MVGSNITYTLTVTNEGPSITTSLTVTDSIPDELTIISSNASVGSIIESGGNLLWSFPILSNNASATMHIVGTSPVPGTLTNIANLGFAEGNLNVDQNFAFAFAYFITTAQKILSVALEPNANTVSLSWPVSSAGFALQETTNLALTNAWQPVKSGIVATNGFNYYTNTISVPAEFYRLSSPY
jgi:uncharacterized repeat protein (TIGR01451 family)